MSMWNRHIHTDTENVHKCSYAERNPKNRKLVRVQYFLLPFWVKGFSTFSIWGFYCDICDCRIRHPPLCAWTPTLNVCTKLTHALSRKALSLTKPKGKIYKTKNHNIKKFPAQLDTMHDASFMLMLNYSHLSLTNIEVSEQGARIIFFSFLGKQ